MATIDLTPAPPAPASFLDAQPRRITVTLPELQLLARQVGGAPLPFDLSGTGSGAAAAAATSGRGLADRLGSARGTTEDGAYAAALATLHDPADSLARRGLVLTGGVVDPSVAGAVGLLAKPEVAVDLDVAVAGVRARAWHRQSGAAVASLATVDGIVFELAWFASAQWGDELARVPRLPEELELRESAVPEVLDLPYELADASGEALAAGRSDVMGVLVGQHAGAVVDATGSPLDDGAVVVALTALQRETRGRLRALVADVRGVEPTPVGVVSWVLLADGWHAVRAHRAGEEYRVEIRAVDPGDLSPALAPVLAEVAS